MDDRPQERKVAQMGQKEALLEISLIDSDTGWGASFVLGDPEVGYEAYLLCAGYERQGEYDKALNVGVRFGLFSEGSEKFLELKKKALLKALDTQASHFEQINAEADKYGFEDVRQSSLLAEAEFYLRFDNAEKSYGFARGELASDSIYLQRFARLFFERKVKRREFNTIEAFLDEFGEHLSPRQRALGAFIVGNADRLKNLPSLPK